MAGKKLKNNVIEGNIIKSMDINTHRCSRFRYVNYIKKYPIK